MKAWTRRALRWTGVVAVLLAFFGSFTVARILRGPGLPEGDRVVTGLDGPVEILFDSLGVPHIWAESMEDLAFGQGYVHVTDRLWQMELYRRVAEGRLSELFGDAAVESDRFLRTIGLARAAERSLALLSPDFVNLAEAYAAGANSAIESWEGPLPPEFILVGATPDPWSPVLEVALEKIMAWDLAEYQIAMLLANSRRQLGDSALLRLLPDYPEWGVTVTEGWPDSATSGQRNPSEVVFGPRERALPPQSPGDFPDLALLPEHAARFLEMGSISRASNSWVVGGERSLSGKPLLANDMHLSLDAPNLWFLVGLHGPGLDVVGMSLPGAPGVVAGHSGAVAWGFTNAMVDDSDLFQERLHPSDTTRYLVPGGSEPFSVREEVIRVKGGEEVRHRVRTTRHGPVVSDRGSGNEREILAFKWQGHEPSLTLQAIQGMNRAQTAGQFLLALSQFGNPHQNVVFADTAGTWGYWMAGRIPIRLSGSPAKLPVPGWTGEYDWAGSVVFGDHPHVLAPERGYVATANNAQGRDSVSLLVNDGGWARPYRAERISSLIEEGREHDASSLAAMQMDVVSLFALKYREQASSAFGRAGLPAEADRLANWDGSVTIPSREASLFFSWIRLLGRRLQEDFYSGGRGYFPLYMVENALDLGWPGLEPLEVEAARGAATAVDDRAWGEIHTLTLDHPMSGIPILGGLLGFGRRGFAREGSTHSINVSDFGGGEPPFVSQYGPSQRHVVDLGDVDGSGGFILPGGQSGFPRARHSFDQLPRWLRGELWLLPISRAGVEARTVGRLRLLPSPRAFDSNGSTSGL